MSNRRSVNLLLAFLLVGLNVFSQKAKFETYDFELNFAQPEIFSKLKTFSYEIQDDGAYWNHNYEEDSKKPENYEDFPTLQSLTDGLKISGLTQVDSNGDLQIVVGFIGSQLKNNQGAIVLRGTMNVMFIIDGNKLVHNITEKVNATITAYLSKYPTSNRFFRNKTKAMILTQEVQKSLDKMGVLFTGKSNINLYFGYYRKTKKGKAAEFNAISKPLVEEIVKNKSKEVLNKAVQYWESQIDVDYGKKLKLKRKLKVIYANLTSANILLGNTEKAEEYSKKGAEYAGFFDSYQGDFKKYKKKVDFVSSYKAPSLYDIKKEGNYAYEVVFNEEGVFDLGNKERPFTKLVLQRFVPSGGGSGIVSLDKGAGPKANLFENEKSTYIYECTEKDSIKLKSGKTIVFKLIKGVYVPFEKTNGKEEKRFY